MGVTVDENNVEVQISALRKALGEDWIITVPKQGYRLAQQIVAAIPAAPPILPDKPSLVVLPFQNMSGDPQQDYFVDGLVEDITTSLCGIRSLFVIARNSAFSYKGQAVDVRQVGRELGVDATSWGRRVFAASVTVNASPANWSMRPAAVHVWTDRFDEALDDVFHVIGSGRRLRGRCHRADHPARRDRAGGAGRRPRISPPTTITSAVLRACTRAAAEAARAAYSLFIKATELHPTYGAAYGLAAFSAGDMKSSGLLAVSAPEIAEGVRLAWLATQDGREDPTALCYAALPRSQCSG